MELAQHNFQHPLPPLAPNGIDKQSSVLQQQSVIQSNQLQQQLQTMHDGNLDSNGKRREILARRPSYRRILDDLAGDGPVKIENYDDSVSSGVSSPEDTTLDEDTINNTMANTMTQQTQPEKQQQYQQDKQPQYPQEKQIYQHEKQQQIYQQDKQPQYQNIHLNGIVSSLQTTASPLHQLHDTQPGEQYIITTQGPDNKIQAYTIKGQLPVGMDNTTLATPHQLAEEATRKRELRLYKNREAARECRRKKKEYVKCLENRVAVLENQNKALIEELKSLKDLYCSKGD